ncbi:molybdopterin biosynthesis protein [Bacillus massiliigorillae]|uniref:molybdopterin biosynthesis protein n=1 Tax=Bacillus massiliigorillae TaxID=1243664 RepID=UPI00039ADAAE|nr:molybdopterin biosynthesis protein [Bacillus massiliigorillae]
MGKHNFYRKVYLEDKPRQQAVDEMLQAFQYEKRVEYLKPEEALGRVTAEPIFAKASMPHYHASAMDGIAVVAENTFTAHEHQPLQMKLNTDFKYVDTGGPVISPYNAVIMIEHVEELDQETIEIIEPATPWQHIRPIGEDIVQEEMILPRGHIIRPVDIGALIAARIDQVPVIDKPIVSIIPTGNELVLPGEQAGTGHLIEYNGTVFASYITEWGGLPNLHDIVPDDPEQLKEAIVQATATSDFVVINAGSSAGSKDYTVHILEELGEVYTHGIATRPGKPVIIAKVNEKIVVGIPGYPVSAYLSLEWLIRPLICQCLGIVPPEREKLTVKLGRRIVSTMGAEDFIRMNIGYIDGTYVATPLTRAAGVTMSLVKADALLIIPPSILGYEQGDLVEVELLKPISSIQSAYIFNGSHDLSIDYLSTFLQQQSLTSKIVSTHTGSMAGMLAIKKGEAHVAGIHLLDSENKTYNTSYVKKILQGENVVLYPFLKRKQGWIVPKGNPLQITSVSDIATQKAMFVNRQKSAGTRILFDLLLQEAGLETNDISGYNREYFTHLSVAAEVKMDQNAVGLGIYSAAKAMGVDFIPVTDESYDLLMKKDFFESKQGENLIKIIQSEAFIREIENMGGYEVVRHPSPIYFS